MELNPEYAAKAEYSQRVKTDTVGVPIYSYLRNPMETRSLARPSAMTNSKRWNRASSLLSALHQPSMLPSKEMLDKIVSDGRYFTPLHVQRCHQGTIFVTYDYSESMQGYQGGISHLAVHDSEMRKLLSMYITSCPSERRDQLSMLPATYQGTLGVGIMQASMTLNHIMETANTIVCWDFGFLYYNLPGLIIPDVRILRNIATSPMVRRGATSRESLQILQDKQTVPKAYSTAFEFRRLYGEFGDDWEKRIDAGVDSGNFYLDQSMMAGFSIGAEFGFSAKDVDELTSQDMHVYMEEREESTYYPLTGFGQGAVKNLFPETDEIREIVRVNDRADHVPDEEERRLARIGYEQRVIYDHRFQMSLMACDSTTSV